MMNDSILALKLRPRNLDDLVGQEKVVAAVRNQLASGRIPRCWMFVGEPGAGKTTISKIIALLLQGDPARILTEEDWEMYNGYCITESNAADTGGVDDMRELIQSIRFLPPPPSKYRIILMNEVQKLTKSAQNSLLVPTEDSESTIWIFTTTDPSAIIPALMRRFETAKYKMQPLTKTQMAGMLEKFAGRENLQADTVRLAEMLSLANITSPAWGICALEKVAAGVSIEEAVGSASSEVDSRELCRDLLQGKWENLKAALENYTSEEVRSLRYMLLAYLKKVVLNGGGIRSRQAAEMICMLSEGAPAEDPALIPWIAARLYLLAKHPNTAVLGKAA